MHTTIQQWEMVDRNRVELRTWLHNCQEEVQDLEQQPAKLHAEAAEIEISKLKVRFFNVFLHNILQDLHQ